MRITPSMSRDNFLRNLYKNNASLNKYGMQLASNRRILRASDDPIGAVRSIQSRKDTAMKEKYVTNVDDAKSWLTQTETALMKINDIQQRLIELAGTASTDLYSEVERDGIRVEAEQLQKELISVANITFSGKYIFAGNNTNQAPFSVESGKLLYNGVDLVANGTDIADEESQIAKYQIGSGLEFDIGLNGVQLMGKGESNLYNVIDQFVTALKDPDSNLDDLIGFQTKFKEGHNKILSMVTDVGGRQSRLELTESRYKDDLINLEEQRSAIEDVDQAEVITKWKQAQVTYETTLSVGSRILQKSLVDFLR